MPPIDETVIRNALRKCKDPELGIDVVSLGLIYKIETTPTSVVVTMTLTTPGCPLLPYFEVELKDVVKQAAGVEDVQINLTFDPPWHPGLINPEVKQQLQLLRS